MKTWRCGDVCGGPRADWLRPVCLRLSLKIAPNLGAQLPVAPWHGGVPTAWHPTEGTTRPGVPVLQMKDSLINLQNGIRSRDYTSEREEKRSRYH